MRTFLLCAAIAIAAILSFLLGYTAGTNTAEVTGKVALMYIKERGDLDYTAGRYDLANSAYEKFYEGSLIARNASLLPRRFSLEPEEFMVLLRWTRSLQLTGQQERAAAVIQYIATTHRKELGGGDVQLIQRLVDKLDEGKTPK
jgi:hypothetical protein